MDRESILVQVAQKLSVTPGITTVTRKPITTAKELNEIAHPMFPVCNVIGGLPAPSGGRAIELAEESYDSSIRSNLDVFIRCFGVNRDNPDTEISTLFETIYQNLYYDPNLKGYDYTDKATNVLIDVGTVIFRTEQEAVIDTQNFKLLESLVDFGETADLITLPFHNPAMFTDVTDTLADKAYSTSIRPSAITEYRDPYYVFTIIMSVAYNHTTYEI